MQSFTAVEYSLIIINSILVAVFTEILVTIFPNNKGKRFCCYFIVNIANFLIFTLVILVIVAVVFLFIPHEENLFSLLEKTAKFYGIKILIPFIVTFFSNCILYRFKEILKKNPVYAILCALVIILNSVQFFFSSFRRGKFTFHRFKTVLTIWSSAGQLEQARMPTW